MTHPVGFFAFVTFVGLGNGIALPNANAGMLSVRPRLAGTASGLGAAGCGQTAAGKDSRKPFNSCGGLRAAKGR